MLERKRMVLRNSSREKGSVFGNVLAVAGIVVAIVGIIVGLLSPEFRRFLHVDDSINKSSYRVGYVVPWISFYEFERGKSHGPDPEDIQELMKQKWAELDSNLKDLEIVVDAHSLDFKASDGDYGNSPAADFFFDKGGSKHGEQSRQAYKLGVMVMATFWMCQRKQFVRDDALRTLAKLNDAAKPFGIKPIASSELERADGPANINKELQSLAQDMDARVRKKL